MTRSLHFRDRPAPTRVHRSEGDNERQLDDDQEGLSEGDQKAMNELYEAADDEATEEPACRERGSRFVSSQAP
jgi:hypothetical protein